MSDQSSTFGDSCFSFRNRSSGVANRDTDITLGQLWDDIDHTFNFGSQSDDTDSFTALHELGSISFIEFTDTVFTSTEDGLVMSTLLLM